MLRCQLLYRDTGSVKLARDGPLDRCCATQLRKKRRMYIERLRRRWKLPQDGLGNHVPKRHSKKQGRRRRAECIWQCVAIHARGRYIFNWKLACLCKSFNGRHAHSLAAPCVLCVRRSEHLQSVVQFLVRSQALENGQSKPVGPAKQYVVWSFGYAGRYGSYAGRPAHGPPTEHAQQRHGSRLPNLHFAYGGEGTRLGNYCSTRSKDAASNQGRAQSIPYRPSAIGPLCDC